MALYTETVMDHFMHPRNVGEIADADGVGEVGNAKCGDIMKMYLKIKDNKIEDVKFETFGGTAIDSRKVRRGEKLTPPMLPVKEGAAFGGWFADQACTKLWSFDSDTVEKSMTLYAKWL